MRRLIDVGGDFIDARQRMQHLHVCSGTVQIAGAQNKLCFHVGVFGRVQTLFLYAGHVEDIDLRHHFFDGAVQAPGNTFFIQHIQNVLRHGQRVRGDEVETVTFELRQRLGQGVDGTAIFQVTHHGDVQIVQATLSFLNGKQVQQRLGGMLVGAVACVQYRNVTGELCSQTCGAFLRMTHDDGVDIGADDGNGIGQGFAFFAQRRVAAVRKTHHAGAQAVHGGFKG